MSDWSSEYLTLLDDCINRAEKLTEWEAKFVDDLYGWVAAGKHPTARQDEVLNGIWDRVTKDG